jgi:beta-glucosidase
MHHPLNTIVVALAAVGLAGAQNSSWNHNLFTSSLPVYPSRTSSLSWALKPFDFGQLRGYQLYPISNTFWLITAKTAGIGWETALAQAEAFLANLTLEEKAGLVTGETDQFEHDDSSLQTPIQALLDLV